MKMIDDPAICVAVYWSEGTLSPRHNTPVLKTVQWSVKKLTNFYNRLSLYNIIYQMTHGNSEKKTPLPVR